MRVQQPLERRRLGRRQIVKDHEHTRPHMHHVAAEPFQLVAIRRTGLALGVVVALTVKKRCDRTLRCRAALHLALAVH